jgi:hypothetical protein
MIGISIILLGAGHSALSLPTLIGLLLILPAALLGGWLVKSARHTRALAVNQ